MADDGKFEEVVQRCGWTTDDGRGVITTAHSEPLALSAFSSGELKSSKTFCFLFFLYCPSNTRRIVDVLKVLSEFNCLASLWNFISHTHGFYVLVVKANLIICWCFNYKKDAIFDMYRHYYKPSHYAPLKLKKNNCHIYAYIEISVYKSKKMFVHR